ncbi:MAG: hypothetical protein IJP48_09805 [Synergistaceae bacterium]|nr:hypothetical protein [Synergistaceae bacterium]
MRSKKDNSENEDFIAAKTRLTLAKAVIAELDAAERKGELIGRSQVNKLWNEKANIVKNKLLGLPELAPLLFERGSIAAIKKELKAKVYEILNELAQEVNDI